MFKKILLYVNTIRYLKPIQVKYQLAKRFPEKNNHRISNGELGIKESLVWQNSFYPDRNMKILISEIDLDMDYRLRFDTEILKNGQINLLHEIYPLNFNTWNEKRASHLWNYNLQYLEYLIPLAYKAQKDGIAFELWKKHIYAWKEHSSRDAYAAYTISIRIPNLLICMELLKNQLDDNLRNTLYESIYEQYQILMKKQELSLLANHYFENLKTLVICSILFREKENYDKFFALFLKQMDEQILPDGVHFELSWMYHKIILEDILRVYTCLTSTGQFEDAAKLKSRISCMVSASASMEKKVGRTPLFNDAGDNVAKSIKTLINACKNAEIQVDDTRTIFPHAGYFKIYDRKNALIIDCGILGPSYMSGHSHCDCLSFELSRKNKPIFVNSGTYQYQSHLRSFFRSTQAHNTVMIDDREQSELWGEHRAARRLSKVRYKKLNQDSFIGEFISYQKDKFSRKLVLKKDSLSIIDSIQTYGKTLHTARQFLHLAPDYCYQCRGNIVEVLNGEGVIAYIAIPKESRVLLHRDGNITNYSDEFGLLKHKEVLEIKTDFQKMVMITIKIKFIGE